MPLVPLPPPSPSVPLQNGPTWIPAAKGVLYRTIGKIADRFQLSAMPERKDGLDAFTVEASSGTVRISGTSGVALTRAAYEYLKGACHVQMTWSGAKMEVNALPDYARRSVVGPNRWRHYFNICTFGYTTAWWNWDRWQQEIDWMALHGINMPLAMTGQDKVWMQTFTQLGLPKESIDRWMAGPAYGPWHWMGNLNGHLGPQTPSWMDGQAALQKRILLRERSLGMKPIVPGFSGFVPTDYSKFHPKVDLQSPAAWCGFAPTTFIDVRSPEFIAIGRCFVQNYRKEFGSDHYYLCDTFNEQNPQFPKATELTDLTASGRSVYQSLQSADPEAKWVMQGWLFYNAADYWTVPRVEALLKDVPQDQMIVLDLATTESAVWKRLPPVRRMGWIFNTLHNYGQNTALQGDLQHIADRAYEDLHDPNRGKLLGMGLTPEGIDQNPVVYELATDAMWTDERLDLASWLPDYVRARYGAEDANAQTAWKILGATIYAEDRPWYRARWRGRPSAAVGYPSVDADAIRPAIDLLLKAKAFRNNERYQRDLVDVTKTWLGALADARLASANFPLAGNASRKEVEFSADARKAFFALLADLDLVMATRPEHRLSTWIGSARAWGNTAEEKRWLEENARSQVTIWGGPVLADYANKEWAGLNADFLRRRWEMHFQARDEGTSVDIPAWEREWAATSGPIQESAPGDPYETCLALFDRHKGDSAKVALPPGMVEDPGIAVGKPVRASSNEGGHGPKYAVDGNPFGDFWAASPAPQWIEVDLESMRDLSGVTIIPYFGDDRSYRYRIELSDDGEAYRTVAEAEGKATMLGYTHKFKASARYVRVTMLSNSANIGVHIQELKVFGK